MTEIDLQFESVRVLDNRFNDSILDFPVVQVHVNSTLGPVLELDFARLI